MQISRKLACTLTKPQNFIARAKGTLQGQLNMVKYKVETCSR